MKTNVVSVGEVNVNKFGKGGFHCFVRVNEQSVHNGVTVFGDSEADVLERLGGVEKGDTIEFEFTQNGKYFNVKGGIKVVEKANPYRLPEPNGQQRVQVDASKGEPELEYERPDAGFKPANEDSKRDARKHEAGLLTQDALEVFEKQLQHKPESVGDMELLTAIFKFLAWRD